MKAHTPNYRLVYAHNWSRNKSRGGVCGIFPVIFPPLTSGLAIPTWSCFTQQRKRKMRKEGKTLSKKKKELLERYTSQSKQNTVISLSQTQQQLHLKCLWGTKQVLTVWWFMLEDQEQMTQAEVQIPCLNLWKYRGIIRKLYGEEFCAKDAKPQVFSFHVHSSWPKLVTINRDGWFQIYSEYMPIISLCSAAYVSQSCGCVVVAKTYNLPKERANLSCFSLLSLSFVVKDCSCWESRKQKKRLISRFATQVFTTISWLYAQNVQLLNACWNLNRDSSLEAMYVPFRSWTCQPFKNWPWRRTQ